MPLMAGQVEEIERFTWSFLLERFLVGFSVVGDEKTMAVEEMMTIWCREDREGFGE